MITLPLFPLPICLMPGGTTELRIFEPRYQRLVKEASINGVGFGMCLFDTEHNQILNTGCVAKIIDFTQMKDGLLGITISGQQRFQLENFSVEADGLKRGQVTLLPNWPTCAIANAEQQHIADVLAPLLPNASNSPQQLAEMSWICQRWLELLPIDIRAKQELMRQPDAHMTQALLQQLIE